MRCILLCAVAIALAAWAATAQAQYYPNGQTGGFSYSSPAQQAPVPYIPQQQTPVWSPPVTGAPAPYIPAQQPSYAPPVYTPPVTGTVNPYRR